MTKRLPQTPVKLLLAATVLVWSLSPPPTQHSHAGGDDPSHHHDHVGADRHLAGIAHESHTASDCGHIHSVMVLSDAAGSGDSHLHFRWLGFRLTLPDSEPNNKSQEDHSTSKLLLVYASRCRISPVQLSDRLDLPLLLLALDTRTPTIAAGGAASGSLVPAVSHPLCDRARHERSGVLLA
jgi:hypothetical protein